MKSLDELQAIKHKMKNAVILREGLKETKVVVGMATCGIAAGARDVLNAFVEGINIQNLGDKVSVSQSGCAGLCRYEPIVEVFETGKEKVTYIEMNAEKVKRVIEEHLKGGKVVGEYTMPTQNA